MNKFLQQVTVLWPVKVSSRYGGDEQLSYAEADGARRVPVPFGVAMQPRSAQMMDGGGNRVATQVGWWLATPRGRDLDADVTCRIGYRGRDMTIVGDIQRWPSMHIPDGVDHVEVELKFREG